MPMPSKVISSEEKALSTNWILIQLIGHILKNDKTKTGDFYRGLRAHPLYMSGEFYRKFLPRVLNRHCDNVHRYLKKEADYEEPFDLEFAPRFLELFAEHFDPEQYDGRRTVIPEDVLAVIRDAMLSEYQSTMAA